MRLSQPRRIFAALLASLTFPQILAGPIDSGSTDLTTLEKRVTTPPPGGQVTPPNQRSGSPVPMGAPGKPGIITGSRIASDMVEWITLQGPEGWAHIPAEIGGCEGWVQVEFTKYIKQKYNIRRGIGNIREQRVFKNPKQAADFTFPPGIDDRAITPQTRGVIVELKVESRSQTKNDFVNLVVKDKEKFAGGVIEEYQGYEKLVLAIAWTAETRQALEGDTASMVRSAGELVHLDQTRDEDGQKVPAMVVELFQAGGREEPKVIVAGTAGSAIKNPPVQEGFKDIGDKSKNPQVESLGDRFKKLNVKGGAA